MLFLLRPLCWVFGHRWLQTAIETNGEGIILYTKGRCSRCGKILRSYDLAGCILYGSNGGILFIGDRGSSEGPR